MSLSVFGVEARGESADDVIRSLIEQTDEFDYYDDEKKDIRRLMFCGLPFGINYNTKEVDGASVITSAVLITSHQSRQDYEMIRDGISKRCGNPDVEEIESVDGEADRIYGRCRWSEAGITLRNAHSDEGGLMIVLQPNILPLN